jgi:hypothetical protein
MGEIFVAAVIGAGIFAAGLLVGVKIIKAWEGWN